MRTLQAERLLREQDLSSAELAKKLGTTTRSVERLLVALRAAGLPLRSERGVRDAREVWHRLPQLCNRCAERVYPRATKRNAKRDGR